MTMHNRIVTRSNPAPAPAAQVAPLLIDGKGLLSSNDVAALLGVSVRSVFRYVGMGKLPQPVRYSRKLVRWTAASLVPVLNQRTEASA